MRKQSNIKETTYLSSSTQSSSQKDVCHKESSQKGDGKCQPPMKSKSPKNEDSLILFRDVTVLKQDIKRLQERVEKLEDQQQKSSLLISTPSPCTSTMGVGEPDKNIAQHSEHVHSASAVHQDELEEDNDYQHYTTAEQDFEGASYRSSDYYGYETVYRAEDYSGGAYRQKNLMDDYRAPYRSRQVKHYALGGKNPEYSGIRVKSPQNLPSLEPSGGLNPVTSTPKRPDKPIESLRDSEYLDTIKRQSASIGNFAARLNCEVFTIEERMQGNVSGTQGKLQLDPQKMLHCKN